MKADRTLGIENQIGLSVTRQTKSLSYPLFVLKQLSIVSFIAKFRNQTKYLVEYEIICTFTPQLRKT